MTIKTCKTAVRASAILAAITLSGGAFGAGASGDSYTFEGVDGTALADAGLTGLTGNGALKTASYSYAAKTSYPLPAEAHASVLEIAGTVAYTNVTAFDNSANKASQVDFMFKVEPTDEALEAPGGTDIQVALAVGVTNANGTTAPIQLYCKTTSGGDAGWTTIAESATVGSWMRAPLVMDYSDSTCKVSLDSDPVNGGAKYYFAGTKAQDYVKSITMVGSTQIDDLVVKNESIASYDPYKDSSGQDLTVTAGSTPVTVKYLNDYGVTQAQATSNEPLDASGMTVEQKYVAGLDPKSGTKFELKTMTPTSATAATVTFPGNNASGYTVKVKDAAGNVESSVNVTTATDATVEGGETLRSATVSLPADKLVYITVEATK